jgi:hypothetical protein
MTVPRLLLQTRGYRNRNPGNIRHAKGVRWQGQADQQPDGAFVSFTDHKWGIRALCRVLITYQDGRRAGDGSKIDCVRDIIERWAPPSENNTKSYQDHVAKLMKVGVDDTLDVYDWHTMKGLVKAIITHELGGQPYDEATLDSGLIAAGLQLPKDRPALLVETSALSAGAIATAAVALPELFDLIRQALQKTGELTAPYADTLPWLTPLASLVVAVAVTVLWWRLRQRRQLTGA